MNRRIFHSHFAFLLAIGLTSVLPAQGPSEIESIGKRNIKKGQPNFTSLARETEIGRQAANQLEQVVTLVEDAEINAYIDRVAQRIAKNSDSQFPISIKIVQSNDVNASALPGGFIYLNTGAIRILDDEAELAFVIAHLVGHVAARHATEIQAKGALFQIASLPSIVLTGGAVFTSIEQGAPLDVPPGILKFSRDAVNEADFLGMEYLYKAGYDPRAAVTVLKKLETLEASMPRQSGMFRTVPPASERIKLTEKNIEKVLPARANNILNSTEFDFMKARVELIRIPDSPPRGPSLTRGAH